MFEIQSTDDATTSAPDMVMYRTCLPAAGDDLGVIVFRGNDDGRSQSMLVFLPKQMM